MFEMADNDGQVSGRANIKVVGIGGGGCNAVNTMIRSGLGGIEFIVANTDAQALEANLAPTKIQLGAEITKGLGAGANPEVGRKAALEEYEKLTEVLTGSDMVFITAGMGGGTGTGAGPVVAKLCKELGALTVGVVTKPFLFEGKKRMRQALAGINVLEESVDSLITIPNQRLLHLAGESLSLIETFKKADNILLNAVQGISDLINHTGLVNADFADVSTVMSNKGLALMGTGICSGSDRAIKAATEAISSPLLEDITIDGATGIIVNITGDATLTTHETNEAMTLIMEAADEEAEIIFGTVIDDNMEDQLKVTVIATGLNCVERAGTGNRIREDVQRSQERMGPVSELAGESVRRNDYVEDIKEEESVSNMLEEQVTASQIPMEESEVERPRLSSSLIQNIKEAAHRYDTKTEQEQDFQANRPPNPRRHDLTDSKTSREADQYRSSRAKSIAEKLGFLNFEEETLDTPSYLRRDRNQQEGNPDF